MKVLIRYEDFSMQTYILSFGNMALEFQGLTGGFALPYQEIRDFCVTKDDRGKIFFTMLCDGRMHEGQILDIQEVEAFITALKERIDGVIKIEIMRK